MSSTTIMSAKQRSPLWTMTILMVVSHFISSCDATVISSGAPYYIKHAGAKHGAAGGCNQGGDLTYMGYLNKTCSAGPSDSVSGATAGPLLRSSSTGNSWTMFTLKKVGKGGKKEDLVEIHTYYPASGKKPLCQGFIVPETKDACTAEPLAAKVHIRAKKGDSWALFPVKGKSDTYTIQSYSRKLGCLKYLGPSAACHDPYLQLYAKDDSSGRQHWIIVPVKAAAPPSSHKFPPPLPKLVNVPAVNYSIAVTGYDRTTFGSTERAAFCNSILNFTDYPQNLMNCTVASVTNVPYQGQSSGGRLTQGSNTAYVQGLTALRFVYGDAGSQQQAEDAADGLYRNMSSPQTLVTMFQSSFPSSTITADVVNRGEVKVPESTLPLPSPSPSPSPSPAASPSASPSPSSPTQSPDFNTAPGGGVITDGPVSSPAPDAPSGGSSTIPGVPIIGTFTANTGIDGVNAAWTAPGSNGGAVISSYDILCTPNTGPAAPAVRISASVCTGGACSTVLTGMTGGTYTCTVRAVNSAGPSSYSSASASFDIVPTIPNAYITNVGDNSLTFCSISSGSCSVPTLNTGGFNMNKPFSIAISGRTAFITNLQGNSVSRCSISSGSITSCTVPTLNTGGFNMDAPAGIAISGSTAFVVNSNGDSITSCTIAGDTITSCSVPTLNTGGFNMNKPAGIAISGSTAYVTNSNSDSVTQCTIVSDTITSCSVPTLNTGGFNMAAPYGIAISGSTALVVNGDANSVSECTISSGSITSCAVSTLNTGAFNMDNPTGITISGSVAYVTNNSQDGFITECTIVSDSITSCMIPTLISGGFNMNSPTGIAIVGPTAYVTDLNGDSITTCTIAGDTITSCAVPIQNPFNMVVPAGIAIAGSTAFVTNYLGGFVTVCPISSGIITNCAVPTLNTGGFNMGFPTGIAISGSTAYIVNSNNWNSVTECTIASDTITSCTVPTLNTGGFNMGQAFGIAISGSTAFIANINSNSVTQCTISSGSITSCAVPTLNTGSGGFNMNAPVYIAISGSVAYVTNNNGNSVTTCTIVSDTITSCSVPNVPGGFALNEPTGIAISGSTAYILNLDGSITECTIVGGTITSCFSNPPVGGFNLKQPFGIALV